MMTNGSRFNKYFIAGGRRKLHRSGVEIEFYEALHGSYHQRRDKFLIDGFHRHIVGKVSDDNITFQRDLSQILRDTDFALSKGC